MNPSIQTWDSLPESIKRQAAPEMLAGAVWSYFGRPVERPRDSELTRWIPPPVCPARRTNAEKRSDVLAALKAERAAGRVGGTTAVVDGAMRGLYFSKEVIPFTADAYGPDAETPVFHHVGVYAYRPDALRAYPGWPIGPLETLEGLEQLRFLESGQPVLCVEVAAQGRKFWELNNPEDVPRIEAMLAEMALP
jgi:CMP-2-keto-3-deoxyoctulosonic acid synthetase